MCERSAPDPSCLPIVKQTKLVGALYLENNLTSRAFTSDRVAVLELLASQAAISLENAGLYADLERENLERKRAEDELRRSEGLMAEGQRATAAGAAEPDPERDRGDEHDRLTTASQGALSVKRNLATPSDESSSG